MPNLQQSQVVLADNWSGSSTDPNSGKSNPNHESHLKDVDVISIVMHALAQFCSSKPEDSFFDPLYRAFKGDEAYVISVTKGIHQVTEQDKPHIQLTTKKNAGNPLTFHLQLDAVTFGFVTAPEAFRWVGVQFTLHDGSKRLPDRPVQRSPKDPGPGRPRSKSVTAAEIKGFAESESEYHRKNAVDKGKENALRIERNCFSDFVAKNNLSFMLEHEAVPWIGRKCAGVKDGFVVMECIYDSVKVLFSGVAKLDIPVGVDKYRADNNLP